MQIVLTCFSLQAVAVAAVLVLVPSAFASAQMEVSLPSLAAWP